MKKTKGLLYICMNHSCINYYSKRNAKGVVISLYDYNATRLPLCFYCLKQMTSELERSIQNLKAELEIPLKTIK